MGALAIAATFAGAGALVFAAALLAGAGTLAFNITLVGAGAKASMIVAVAMSAMAPVRHCLLPSADACTLAALTCALGRE